jgi:FdhD protein
MTQVSSITPVTVLPQHKLHQAQLSEVAVAVSLNGISHAVMMVSPKNLKDFALGFALSEGLIHSTNEVLDMVVQSHENGWQVDLQVLARVQHRLKQRRRTMAGPSGCGLCGLDSIEAAMALELKVNSDKASHKKINLPSEAMIIQAKDTLPNILQQSGGVRGNHCAAYFDLSAKIIAFREDVGRHSALDKLLGCLSKENKTIADGFALITSRCSHDLIAKAVRLSLRALVTLAQPTDLAVSSARKMGLALFCFQHGQLKRFA